MTKKVVKKTVKKSVESKLREELKYQQTIRTMAFGHIENLEREQIGLYEALKEAKELKQAYHDLNLAKSFALVAFGMTLGALIWMWL